MRQIAAQATVQMTGRGYEIVRYGDIGYVMSQDPTKLNDTHVRFKKGTKEDAGHYVEAWVKSKDLTVVN